MAGLLLVSTSDKLSLVTDAVANVDVHADYFDYLTGNVTPGRKNTAIVSATTTDIVLAPAASTYRNIKQLTVRNKSGAVTVNVTVTHTDGTTTVELHQANLAPGEALGYAEDVGFYKMPAITSINPAPTTTDQTIGASVTNYITGSDIHIPSNKLLKVGTILEWKILLTKTAAATVSMTFDSRWGTTGTTADTTRQNLPTGVQTAVADTGILTVRAIVRAVGASGRVQITMQLVHGLNATGLSANAAPITQAEATFDNSAAIVAGVSLTTGALHSITIQQVIPSVINI